MVMEVRASFERLSVFKAPLALIPETFRSRLTPPFERVFRARCAVAVQPIQPQDATAEPKAESRNLNCLSWSPPFLETSSDRGFRSCLSSRSCIAVKHATQLPANPGRRHG